MICLLGYGLFIIKALVLCGYCCNLQSLFSAQMKKSPLHVEPKYNLEINQTAFRCHGRQGHSQSALTMLLIIVFTRSFIQFLDDSPKSCDLK